MTDLQAQALLQLARALDVCRVAGLDITGTVATPHGAKPLNGHEIRAICARKAA